MRSKIFAAWLILFNFSIFANDNDLAPQEVTITERIGTTDFSATFYIEDIFKEEVRNSVISSLVASGSGIAALVILFLTAGCKVPDDVKSAGACWFAAFGTVSIIAKAFSTFYDLKLLDGMAGDGNE